MLQTSFLVHKSALSCIGVISNTLRGIQPQKVMLRALSSRFINNFWWLQECIYNHWCSKTLLVSFEEYPWWTCILTLFWSNCPFKTYCSSWAQSASIGSPVCYMITGRFSTAQHHVVNNSESLKCLCSTLSLQPPPNRLSLLTEQWRDITLVSVFRGDRGMSHFRQLLFPCS